MGIFGDIAQTELPGIITTDPAVIAAIQTVVSTGLNPKGNWNATTNVPVLADNSGGGVSGDFYIVDVAGTTLIDGHPDWAIGDWIYSNGTIWDRIPSVSVPENHAHNGVDGTSKLLGTAALIASASDTLLGRATSGPGSIEAIACTAAGRALIDDASAIAQRATLGLGTAAVASTADFDAVGSAASAQAAAIAASQPVDAELTALAGLVSAADRVPYFTGSGVAALAALTALARTILSNATAGAMRTTLEIGTYGGFYAYERAILLGIDVQNVYHPFHQMSGGDVLAGELNGFTFNAGRIVDPNIVSEANNGVSLLRIVTNTTHLLTTDDIIVVTKANNSGHNKPTKVTVINPTTFDCQNIPYVAGAGTSAAVIHFPAFIRASTGSDGIYHLNFTSSFTLSSNQAAVFELMKEVYNLDNTAAERMSTGSIGTVSACGNIEVAAGDRIWLTMRNISGTADITIKHMNINVHKIS